MLNNHEIKIFNSILNSIKGDDNHLDLNTIESKILQDSLGSKNLVFTKLEEDFNEDVKSHLNVSFCSLNLSPCCGNNFIAKNLIRKKLESLNIPLETSEYNISVFTVVSLIMLIEDTNDVLTIKSKLIDWYQN